MKTEIMTVTPATAKAWLEATTFRNRNITRAAVKRYANDMRTGRWELNGESIVIDDNGNVVDGQHRLHAIIESGVSIKTVVVKGVDCSVFPTFDIGKQRSGCDILGIAGYANSRTLAAAIRCWWELTTVGFCNAPRGTGWASRERLDILGLVKSNPGIVESASYIQARQSCDLFRPPGYAACLHYHFGNIDASSRDEFFDSIYKCVPVFGERCPTITVRKKYGSIPESNKMAVSMLYRYKCWESPFLRFSRMHANLTALRLTRTS